MGSRKPVDKAGQGTGDGRMSGRENLRALARTWIDARAARGELHGESVRVENARIASLLRLYGDAPPEALDRAALLEWQAAIGDHKPATRRKYIGTIRRFCNWLSDEGYLDANPAGALVKVREPRAVPRALRADSVGTTIEACSDLRWSETRTRWKAIACLMVECGIRCVGISRLDLGDLDLEAWTVEVREKFDNERVLPIPEAAREPLLAYLDERGWRQGPLFVSVSSKSGAGRRLSAHWISKKMGRIMHDAGVHEWGDGRSAHALRHTAASDVLEKCGDLRAVQEMMGHLSLATTERYLRRANLGRLRAAMEGRHYMRDGPSLVAGTLRGAGSRGALSPQAPDPTEGRPAQPGEVA